MTSDMTLWLSQILQGMAIKFWTWLEVEDADARYSDNLVHLRHGESIAIRVTLAASTVPAGFRKRLRVRSLADACRMPV